jgi:uncharacterized protein (DUF1697 family)
MRYVAFLRAINVGGRFVKMDELRRHLISAGFSGVQTFIASGNVIFESAAKSTPRLESTIERSLHKALGYEVATFVRSVPELAVLSRHPLVSGEQVPKGASLFVMFLRDVLTKERAKTLEAFSTDVDDLRVHERHVLWTIRGGFMDSKINGSQLERTIGMPGTVRNATTVRKIAAKFGG